MRTLIYFTRELPGLSEDLIEAGFQVYEALAISDVFCLAEQYPSAIVVIDSSVEDLAALEIARSEPTLRLKPRATAADVIWRLSELSPDAGIQ